MSNNTFSVMLVNTPTDNRPVATRFGQLLEYLGTAPYAEPPPKSAQLHGNLARVEVITRCCADCLKEKLEEAGFVVTVASTKPSEHNHEMCLC